MSLYDRLFKPRRYTLPNGAVVEEKRSRAPLVILIVLALGALSVHITGFDFAVLVKKGSKFFDILKAMIPPNTGPDRRRPHSPEWTHSAHCPPDRTETRTDTSAAPAGTRRW